MSGPSQPREATAAQSHIDEREVADRWTHNRVEKDATPNSNHTGDAGGHRGGRGRRSPWRGAVPAPAKGVGAAETTVEIGDVDANGDDGAT